MSQFYNPKRVKFGHCIKFGHRMSKNLKMNNLRKGTIKELQRYVSEKIKERGFEDETLQERLLLLTEGIGELVKACRKMNEMYVDVNKQKIHNLGGELTDVINLAFAVGIVLNLDIEKEFLLKEVENDKRVWKRKSKI